MIMRVIIFIMGLMFLWGGHAVAQNSTGNSEHNPPNVNEIKVQSNENFDVNQKYRVDKPVKEETNSNKKSIRVDRSNRIPMTKVAEGNTSKAERREE